MGNPIVTRYAISMLMKNLINLLETMDTGIVYPYGYRELSIIRLLQGYSSCFWMNLISTITGNRVSCGVEGEVIKTIELFGIRSAC